MSSTQEIIEFDVGGMKYKTTKTTILKGGGSLLSMLIEREKNKEIFIDRDGHLFIHILNWLRNGKLNPKISEIDLEYLKLEADYYGFQTLIEQLEVKKIKITHISDKSRRLEIIQKPNEFKQGSIMYIKDIQTTYCTQTNTGTLRTVDWVITLPDDYYGEYITAYNRNQYICDLKSGVVNKINLDRNYTNILILLIFKKSPEILDIEYEK